MVALRASHEFVEGDLGDLNILNLPTTFCEPECIATLTTGQINHFGWLEVLQVLNHKLVGLERPNKLLGCIALVPGVCVGIRV